MRGRACQQQRQQQQHQQQQQKQQQQHQQEKQQQLQYQENGRTQQLQRLHQQNPQLQQLIALTNNIKAADVGLPDEAATLRRLLFRLNAPICHINIMDSPRFTMSIFIIRKGMKLPLHDHPGMTGIIKVLYGTIKITSYRARGRDNALTLDEHSNLMEIPVTRHPDVIVDPSSDCQVLTPYVGNFHTLQSVGDDAAMFDILAPPYDEQRECNFYHEVPTVDVCGEDGATGTDVFLQRIPQPPSFYCDQLDYMGPSLEGFALADERVN